ncbi:MAG: GDSL-type esterase/lipase family protein [Capsulimonadaceae bacterium]|nr:GDSL-type esterase/lipase family protein [Capsulimonadaceae bacterium]
MKADLQFKAGDRVVIYGDSITEQRLYSRYIQQYVYCRYPELKVRFFNAGWGGDTAAGAWKRCERDVLALKPTLVTLFFGMNDGRYQTINDDILNNYRTTMEGLIKALTDKGIRVVVFTPGCVDTDKNPGLKPYNDNLGALANVAIELAKKYNLPYGDIHQPMLAYQTAQKASHPGYTFSYDGVHPMPAGHQVMTYSMLNALGVAPMPPLGSVDVKTSKSTEGIKLAGNSGGVVTLTAMPSNMPYWIEPGSINDVRACGMADLAGQKLTVTGLDAGDYTVTVGKFTTSTSAAGLAAGVPILGTYSDVAQSLHDLVATKENLYFTAWRQIRLPYGDTPGTSDAYASLIAADDALNTMIYSLKPPATVDIVITGKPKGANLALGKKYVAVDENKYNWGIGGLTDGSWEASSAHCFASGDGGDFPKTVTIDLEQPTLVGAAVLGVPPFGATKTIQVSVSTDGTTFTQVGSHEFACEQEARFTYGFTPVQARYVRLTYPDHYTTNQQYGPNFVFTTECEVYAAMK